MGQLNVIKHPLIETKLTMLRSVDTGSKEFREIVEEMATLLFYEATKDVPLVDIEVQTPLCKTLSKTISTKFAIIPILRAGIGMVNGILNLMPTTKVGHIGLYRDPQTLQPVEYFIKLPVDCHERDTFVIDPMLATGGTSSAAITCLKKRGINKIKLICLLGCPEGANKIMNDHPDVNIYVAGMDPILNDHAYIEPGLGDAGDRLFGTK